jgi:hypothetical protein
VAGLVDRPVEARFLGSAAVLAAMRRAGWRAETDPGEAPRPAPLDPRPSVGPAAGWLLRRALDERVDLVPEWLELARGIDRRPPDDELPRLLALAARQAETRAALAPLVGPRAHWLVDQIPELLPGLTGDPLSAELDPADAWAAAPGAAGRAAIVADLRSRDPAAARAFLDGAWEQATTEERALAIATLARGLGPDDEPLLVRAWEDRRVEVRSAAIDRLARRADSSFAALASTVARPLLALSGRFRPSLEVQPPLAWSEGLERLGVPRKPPQGTGERAWWLRHVVARTNPARWEEWLAAPPGQLIERARQTDDAAALLLGWIEAADRHADGRWAAALLADRDVLGREDVQAIEPFRLLDHLAAADRDRTAVALIGVADAPVARLVAERCPAPWSPTVADAVMKAIVRTAGTIGWSVPAAVRDLAQLAARRSPPSAIDELERILGELGQQAGGSADGGLADVFDVLRFRLQLATAFATEARP